MGALVLIVVAHMLFLVRGSYDKTTGMYLSNSTSFNEESARIRSLLQLSAGMTYCEMGAANGRFMVLLGKSVVPGGKVLVTEANNNSLAVLETEAQRAGIEASIVLATRATSGLPVDACDAIMSRMVYHMINETVAVGTYLPQLKQALKRNGKMLILDHDPDNGATTRFNATLTKKNHSMHVVPRLQEIREFTSAGFALVKMLEWPWFGKNEHGYALMWTHQAPIFEDRYSLQKSNLRGDVMLQEVSTLSHISIAVVILTGISAAISCGVLLLVLKVSRKVLRLVSGRAKVPTNECD